jgi:hypothetical protein
MSCWWRFSWKFLLMQRTIMETCLMDMGDWSQKAAKTARSRMIWQIVAAVGGIQAIEPKWKAGWNIQLSYWMIRSRFLIERRLRVMNCSMAIVGFRLRITFVHDYTRSYAVYGKLRKGF